MPSLPTSPTNWKFLLAKQRWQRLARYGFPANDLRHLKRFVQQADLRLLWRANPRLLAQRLNWREPYTLDVLTAAVAEGLYQLEWEAYCGVCGALLQRTDQLAEIETHQTCESCQNEGELHLDEEITPRVSATAAARRLPPRPHDDPEFRSRVDAELGRLPALTWINRPLFRQLLGEQALPPNNSLGVGHLAVFFSDLKDSTHLYQRLGDGTAYRLVRQHIEAVETAVEAFGGSVVKIIGDGIMGVFTEDDAAIESLIRSVQAVQQLNAQAGLQGEDRLHLKVGLHAGPCIVVTLNSRLDYFGSTVNIASRLSDLAGGDEIWLSQALLHNPAVRQVITQYPRVRENGVRLRGLAGEVDVCRLSLGET